MVNLICKFAFVEALKIPPQGKCAHLSAKSHAALLRDLQGAVFLIWGLRL